MRTDLASIYGREFEKALDEGLPQSEAMAIAKERAEEIYWNLVDRGRQEAKDRQLEK